MGGCAVAIVAVVAAGWGGGNSADPADPQVSAHGKQVFTQRCGNCHALKAADTRGGVGPNLDDVKPDEDKVTKTVQKGRGAMPSFAGQLSEDDIRAVAQYVSENACN